MPIAPQPRPFRETTLITVSLFYPATPGGRFDFDYYLSIHMPMSIRLLGAPITAVTVERGITGPESDAAHPFVAVCRFTCQSREAFEAAFLPHADILQQDMAHYTDIAPIIQFSDLALTL